MDLPSPNHMDLLKSIASRKVTDDANLTYPQQILAKFLYVNGYINALLLEDSDSPIEVLSLTKKAHKLLVGAKGRKRKG